MQKWEYQVVTLNNFNTDMERTEVLNEYRDWELVSVDNGIAYFKRPIDEAARNRERTAWSEEKGWYLKDEPGKFTDDKPTDDNSLVELNPEIWTQDMIEKHFIEVSKIGDQSILVFRPK